MCIRDSIDGGHLRSNSNIDSEIAEPAFQTKLFWIAGKRLASDHQGNGSCRVRQARAHQTANSTRTENRMSQPRHTRHSFSADAAGTQSRISASLSV